MPDLAQPDVVVHLPSGPVAGAVVGDRHVDVAGVLLPWMRDERGELLAMLPPRTDATGGTDTVYARVELYTPGALERVSGAHADGEHQQRADEHQEHQREQQRAGHGAKVGRRAPRQQSGGRR